MKRSIIDFIRWSGEIGVLAYRHPKANISKYAKPLETAQTVVADTTVTPTPASK